MKLAKNSMRGDRGQGAAPQRRHREQSGIEDGIAAPVGKPALGSHHNRIRPIPASGSHSHDGPAPLPSEDERNQYQGQCEPDSRSGCAVQGGGASARRMQASRHKRRRR